MRINENTQLFQPPESLEHIITFDLEEAEFDMGWLARCTKCGRRFDHAVQWTMSACYGQSLSR